MPTTDYNAGRVSWHQALAHLFGVAGQYCSIIEWAGLALAIGQTVECISKMTKSLTVLNSLNSLEWSDMILTVWMGLESE